VEKERQRWTSQFLSKHQGDRGEKYFETYYRNGSAQWFREIKMNRHAFVLINRMRASYISLKTSLNRFSILSTTECACGDGLQTEEHIFWDCKRYEEQRATMRNILSENSKKEYPSQLQSP
jgi:hypothetical protein